MSKYSVASKVDCESMDSSLSSVFTDNEVLTETKKKKPGRTKKIRNTEDLRDCFKISGSLESVSGSESAVKKRRNRSVRPLIEIPLSASASLRSSRKKKKPVFTLPDITYVLKSDVDDVTEEASVTQKAKKKKIRYTLDLNTLSNDQRDSDVAARARPKKTKKAKLPSFLPTVDIIDECKKINETKAAENASSDNKENDTNTDTTDSEEAIKKGRKGTTRRTKKKTSEDEIVIDLIDESKKFNKTKAVENSHLNKEENETNTDTTDSETAGRKERKSRPRRTLRKTCEDEIACPDGSEVHTKIENKNLKLSVFNVSSPEVSNTPNKTGHTSDFNDESIHTCPEISPEHDSVNVSEESFKKSSKRAYFDMSSSNDLEASWLINSRESTKNLNSNSINKSTPESYIIVPEPNASTKISETAVMSELSNRNTFEMSSNKEDISDIHEDRQLNKSQSLKGGTFNISSNPEGAFDTIESSRLNKSRKSTRNRSSSSIKEPQSISKSIPVPNASTTISETTVTSERSNTFEISPNKEDISDIYEDGQLNKSQSLKGGTFNTSSNSEGAFDTIEPWLNKSRKSTRNRSNFINECPSIPETLVSVPGPDSSTTISKTSLRSERSKRNTSEILCNMAETLDIPQGRQFNTKNSSKRATNFEDASNKMEHSELNKSRQSTRNHSLNHMNKSQSTLESHSTVSEINASTTISKASFRTEPARRNTSEISSNIEDSDILQDHQLKQVRRSTRNTESNLESLNTESDINSSRPSIPNLELSSSKEYKGVSGRVSNRPKFEIDDPTVDLHDKMVPPRKHSNIVSISDSSESEEDHSEEETVIDLTDSVYEDSGPSPSKRPRRSTLNKEPVAKRKGSFEVSFSTERNHGHIIENLNITNSRKSSFKKKSSSCLRNSDYGTSGGKFVTLRRQREWQTMIDFDTGDSPKKSACKQNDLKKGKNLEDINQNRSEDKNVLSDKGSSDAIADPGPSKGPTPKKSILKKSMGTARKGVRRDTFEIAECFYDIYDSVESMTRPVETQNTEPPRDIFDFVSRTPTAKLDKLGSGESLIMGKSFLNDSNISVVPRLTRESTFTKEEEVMNTPPPSRKSTRKRWSQVERTPVFDKMPKGHSSIVPDQTIDTTLENTINKSKSVTIKTPPNFSPRNYLLRTTSSKVKTPGKKSVKIETPVKTPRVRLHSPLVMRKTPVPKFDLVDNSILSGNCVGNLAPEKTSTPYPKKKDISLLKKVLTSEKNKSEKNISLRSTGKNSVRSKMPNFAKIHQRQYEKMENLKDMQERKAVRAQFLLSGSKPPVDTSVPKIIAGKESRKQLVFSPKKPEPTKVASNTSSSRLGKANTSKHLSKPLQHMLNKRTSLDKKKKEIKSRVPVAIAKPVAVETAKIEPKGFTRFGFKLPTGKENVTRDEQIKAVTAKSKITVNRTETNRKQLGGVRSNRRFDLLMKMRESKK